MNPMSTPPPDCHDTLEVRAPKQRERDLMAALPGLIAHARTRPDIALTPGRELRIPDDDLIWIPRDFFEHLLGGGRRGRRRQGEQTGGNKAQRAREAQPAIREARVRKDVRNCRESTAEW